MESNQIASRRIRGPSFIRQDGTLVSGNTLVHGCYIAHRDLFCLAFSSPSCLRSFVVTLALVNSVTRQQQSACLLTPEDIVVSLSGWGSSHSSLPWRLPPLLPREQQYRPPHLKRQSRTVLLQAMSPTQGSLSPAGRLPPLMEDTRSSVSSRRTVSNDDSSA